MSEVFDPDRFAARLGIAIRNQDLFQESVTHRSYLNEHRGYHLPHNERLEFLGDAVLELVVTEYLYHRYPNPEGELTAFRAAIVNGEILAEIAGGLGVEAFLLMSRGESKDTGRARMWLLANAMEAIIGALYLDQGYEASREFIARTVISELPRVIEEGKHADPKSRFQEKSQEVMGVTPTYRVLREWGPDHDRRFVSGAYIGDDLIAEGEGNSKQEAQRSAAVEALKVKGWE